MFKLLLVLVAVAGVLFFTPAGNTLKAKVISVVNPALAEKQSLSSAQANLKSIATMINGASGQNLSSAQKSALNSLIDNVTGDVSNAQDTADQSDVAASIGALINKVLPQASPECPTPTH